MPTNRDQPALVELPEAVAWLDGDDIAEEVSRLYGTANKWEHPGSRYDTPLYTAAQLRAYGEACRVGEDGRDAAADRMAQALNLVAHWLDRHDAELTDAQNALDLIRYEVDGCKRDLAAMTTDADKGDK